MSFLLKYTHLSWYLCKINKISHNLSHSKRYFKRSITNENQYQKFYLNNSTETLPKMQVTARNSKLCSKCMYSKYSINDSLGDLRPDLTVINNQITIIGVTIPLNQIVAFTKARSEKQQNTHHWSTDLKPNSMIEILFMKHSLSELSIHGTHNIKKC